MSIREDFEVELNRVFQEAEQKSVSCIDVVSGELHRDVGGYPGSNHRMPTCCSVMRKAMGPNDKVLDEPDSGKGATLKIRYYLPRKQKLGVIEEETVEMDASTSLSLERDLEESLLLDLEQIEPGLQLYRTESVSGQQLNTGKVGRLDILAIDHNDALVVIELKAGQADDSVCGQILRYMGWVEENLAAGREVRGIIVANSFSDALKYAARAMSNVALKKYEVYFKFTDI